MLAVVVIVIIGLIIYSFWHFRKHGWQELKQTTFGAIVTSAGRVGESHPRLGWSLAVGFMFISLILTLHAIRIELQPPARVAIASITPIPVTPRPRAVPTIAPSQTVETEPSQIATPSGTSIPRLLANPYVAWKKLLPVHGSTASYALLVEFGVRCEPTEGMTLGVNTGVRYTYHTYWYGESGLGSNKEAVAPRTIGVFIGEERAEPPRWVLTSTREFLTPTRSIYVYFEAETPFNVENDTLYVNSRFADESKPSTLCTPDSQP